MNKSLSALALALLVNSAQAENLLQILELAEHADLKLSEAQAIRDASLEARPQSVARLLPKLSITGEMQRNSVLSKFQEQSLTFIAGARNTDFWSSAAEVRLNMPVYHHELWVQLAQADHRIAYAEANYAAEQQNLMLRTAQAYFAVLLAQDSLEFADTEQRAIARQLEQAQARYTAGLVRTTDVNEAKAGYDRARANAIAAANDLESAKEALREIVGEFSGHLQGLAADIPLTLPQPNNIDQWNEQAQQNNLAIIAASNAAEIARKNIELQFAGHLPSLDMFGSAGFTDNNRPRGISTESQVIGMQVTVPLFNGGAVNSQVRQAQHELKAAQDRLDAQRRTVRHQIKDAFRSIGTAVAQVEALQAAVISAESAVASAEAGFEVGNRTMVDVLNEQRNLFRNLRDYAKTRYDYLIGSLTLKQAASSLRPEDLALINHWLSKATQSPK